MYFLISYIFHVYPFGEIGMNIWSRPKYEVEYGTEVSPSTC